MPEDRLVLGCEQVVGPGDGIAHGLQAGGNVARTAGEQLQAIREPRQQRLRRENLGARRRQLDGKRQSVEPAAHFGDRFGIFRS